MKIIIRIECETINNFWQHLNVLQGDIKKESKRLKLNPLDDEFTGNVELNDDNCYGRHEVKILPDAYDLTEIVPINKLIETLKKDFTGDISYLSGVNDGMYHLLRNIDRVSKEEVNNKLTDFFIWLQSKYWLPSHADKTKLVDSYLESINDM